LADEKEFAKILEAKVDLNFKIAKLLTGALGWEIDFNSFRQGKQTIVIPLKTDLKQESGMASNLVSPREKEE
jgi:hypothetical protein